MKFSQLGVIACMVAGLSTSMVAQDFDYDIHLGVLNFNMKDGDKGANFNIGYGVTKKFESGIIMGVSGDLEYTRIQRQGVYSLGGDLKLGYNVWDKLNLYAIGGYKIQNIDDTTGYGFGYGAGIEYPITQRVWASFEYKTYAMTCSDRNDYDFSTAGFKLKYTF